MKSTTTSDSFILIQGSRQFVGTVQATTKVSGQSFLDNRETSATTNQFNKIDFFRSDTSQSQGFLDRSNQTITQGTGPFHELFTLDLSRYILVIHQAFNIKHSHGVSTQNLLDFFTSLTQTKDGLGVRGKIHAILFAKFFDIMLDQDLIKVSTHQVTITSSGLDHKFTLDKGDHCDLIRRVTHIDKSNHTRLGISFRRIRKISLGNTIGESGSSGIIHQAKTI